MEIGIFLMPAHPPGAPSDATRDLDVMSWPIQLGTWRALGRQHFTVPWEPICAPDLLLAQALLRTQQILKNSPRVRATLPSSGRVGPPGGYFDLAQGRFVLGVGASVHPR